MAHINMGAVLGDIIKGALGGLTGGPAGAIIGGIAAGVQDVVGKPATAAPAAPVAAPVAAAVIAAINNSDTVAVVPVAPAVTTPDLWGGLLGIAMTAATYFGLPSNVSTAVSTAIAAVTTAGLLIYNTFFKKTVTPTAVAASQPNGTSTV